MSDITPCNKSMNHQWFTHLVTLLIDGHDYYVYIWQNIDVNTQKKHNFKVATMSYGK